MFQQFNSHSDESDPERIRQIIDKAVEDSEWLLKKVLLSMHEVNSTF